MKILVIIHEGFGGRGGIAKFNRDLLRGLARSPLVSSITILPRFRPVDSVADLAIESAAAAKLDHRWRAVGGRLWYLWELLRIWRRGERYDLVICGHLRLLPLLLLVWHPVPRPRWLVLHGVEAWQEFRPFLTGRLLRRITRVLAVSEFTAARFQAWTGFPKERLVLQPNAVNPRFLTPGPKSSALLKHYGLEGRRILMGMGRLESREQYKGFDQIIEAMPVLLASAPDLAYVICGDGNDRPRLEARVAALGLERQVIFTGYIAEAAKLDHYRLADLFVLAGWGEGFGIVLIEAMAVGVPVIASCLDGSQEAVAGGRLGQIVNPLHRAELIAAIQRGLAGQGLPSPQRPVPQMPADDGSPESIHYWSEENFDRRIAQKLAEVSCSKIAE
ncbi:MAG: glycosyltransferase [Alphaproteobacteria bacterium]|nr:glycosyltransferase [Alphaproteobacteria bacterium]